jgi:hypothetical protein
MTVKGFAVGASQSPSVPRVTWRLGHRTVRGAEIPVAAENPKPVEKSRVLRRDRR